MRKLDDSYGQYGRTAIKAAGYARNSGYEPMDAWNRAASEEIARESTRNKGCPRSAFLCLCESNLVNGIAVRANERRHQYARVAVERLRENNSLSTMNPAQLWKTTVGEYRSHQGEMNVVLALWNQGFIKMPV